MKCKYCKEYIKKQDAYVVASDKCNQYFCSEDHYNLFVKNKENEKQIKINTNKEREKIYCLICEIIGRKDIVNTFLFKEWKEWNKVVLNETILQYLEDNKSFLHDAVSGIENNEFSRIRYLSAILKNNLSDYMTNRTVEDVSREDITSNIKTILGLNAKYSNLNDFTNAYIEMYLNPLNKWDNFISLEDKIQFIFVANILNEDEIAKYITGMPYADFLCTPYWKTIADYVKHKYDGVCKLCGHKDNLNVHHKTYDNHGYEHRAAVIESDLIILCRDCHEKIHGIK